MVEERNLNTGEMIYLYIRSYCMADNIYQEFIIWLYESVMEDAPWITTWECEFSMEGRRKLSGLGIEIRYEVYKIQVMR